MKEEKKQSDYKRQPRKKWLIACFIWVHRRSSCLPCQNFSLGRVFSLNTTPLCITNRHPCANPYASWQDHGFFSHNPCICFSPPCNPKTMRSLPRHNLVILTNSSHATPRKSGKKNDDYNGRCNWIKQKQTKECGQELSQVFGMQSFAIWCSCLCW